MAEAILQQCRDHLVRAYEDKLGLTLSAAITETRHGRVPVWQFVSDDDLTSQETSEGPNAAGLLLDQEIGILCYILVFKDKERMRAQIRRALAIRSQLLVGHAYEDTPTGNTDERGSWRVAMHWVTSSKHEKEAWIGEAQRVRQETAFSEELSIDVVDLSTGDPRRALAEYGFPRLLLTVREVFGKSSFEHVTQWLTADNVVADSLSHFDQEFSAEGARECARVVVDAVSRYASDSTKSKVSQVPASPRVVSRLHLKNFRNFEDFVLEFGRNLVDACVIHGPNGTGKSSLCEAISVGLFGTSSRYERFLGSTERDVGKQDRRQMYKSKYLRHVWSRPDPVIGLDDAAPAEVALVDEEAIAQARSKMRATILTQDVSLEFSLMSADELGARILSGYSDLAGHVERVVELRVARAEEARKSLLRRCGLNASITRIETAHKRIAESEINTSLAGPSAGLIEWLEIAAGTAHGAKGAAIAASWREWDGVEREQLAGHLAASHATPAAWDGHVRGWLDRYDSLVSRTKEFVSSLGERLGALRGSQETTLKGIERLGRWLEARDDRETPADSGVSVSDMEEQRRHAEDRGRLASARLTHLREAERFLRSTWAKHKPEECPTCGAKHSQPGGIIAIFDAALSATAAERDRLREEYRALGDRLAQTRNLPSRGGPLSDAERAELTDSVEWMIEGARLLDVVANERERKGLVRRIQRLCERPLVPSSVDVGAAADLLVSRVLDKFREAEATWKAPSNWKPVREKLTKTLAGVLQRHLPSTLEGVWRELVLNLTAAPWLLLANPRISVESRKGEKKAQLLIRERLARYVLNEAELHVLGLGWFITEYLTKGRFDNACLVMDDPAHELDQTSFREMCRLVETLMRLHRVYARPLRLIVMLHQESRAIDAARATCGRLAVLGWHREQGRVARTVKLLDDGFRAPQPIRLFQAAKG